MSSTADAFRCIPATLESRRKPLRNPRLRIGLMLRHFDQHGGGVKVYTQQLVKALLQLDSPHEFVLFFRNPDLLGTFSHMPAVHEVLVPGRSILHWDQVAIPRAVEEYGIDVLFNPKYSIPLRVRCPTAWVCHGLDWYVMPEASPWRDRLSHRFLVPRYAAKADAIVAVSGLTHEHVQKYLKVPAERIHTIYPGLNPAFRKPGNASAADVRRRFGLPERYVLYSGAIYPPKNFTRLVHAYARVGPSLGVSLVIAGGENRYLSRRELCEPARLGLGDWVRWLGWIDNDSMPEIYRQADALLMPSLFESVGLPVLEAMASGCPVLTSDRWGTKELADGAAMLVDPESVDAIASGLSRMLTDEALRQRLSQAGRRRAELFDWQRAARQTLDVLEKIGYAQRATEIEPGISKDGPELPLGLGGATPSAAAPWWHSDLLECTHDAIIIWEMDGAGILYWNQAAERLYGYGRAEAHGQVTHRLLRTRSSHTVGELEAKLARYGVWVGELHHTARDGREVQVEGRLALMSQRNGRWLVLEVNRDITDVKRALEAREEMESGLLRLRKEAATQPVGT